MARIYVGNLPMDVKEREIDDLFYKYGRIRSIDIKVAARPPAFAFISFEDTRDAEDAVRGRDGYEFDGMRLRCEFSKAERRDGYGGGGGRDFGRGPPQRSEFGVIVTNLPKACSWQDLKDHMRKAGAVLYADIDRNSGDGEVEFAERRDMEYALDKMDDQEFRHKSGETTYIRVKSRSRGGGGRSRSRDRSRSPPPRDRSKSRDRSPAHAEKDRSRSRTRD